MKLQIDRQRLEDLNSHFMPFLLMSVTTKMRDNKGTELETFHRLCLSVMSDIDLIFKRKLLTAQRKFSIKLKEAEGIIFMKGLMNFPIPADHFWRLTLRNQIVEQLDKQITGTNQKLNGQRELGIL